MRIIKKDYRKNFVRAQVESMDDLWYLTYIIEKSDILKASTYRKVKLGKEDERNTKIIRKYSNVLRVSGIIREGPDDIPLGSHHTISLEGGTEFSLQKQALLKYQIEKLEESAEGLNSKIMLVVHDREEAYFAQLKKYGFEMLGQIKGDVQKKADVKTETSDFFAAIKKTVEDYDKRHNFSNIIIASPGFWKEYIQKIITGDLKKKVVYATCSSVGVNGINEVIKRDEVQQVLKLEKFADESRKVEGFLGEIAKKGKAQYGLKEIKEAVDSGAVSELLVTDRLIQKKRQDNTFEQVEYMMKAVENMQGEVHIISSEHEAGSKLDGLGGMGAILRYKINY